MNNINQPSSHNDPTRGTNDSNIVPPPPPNATAVNQMSQISNSNQQPTTAEQSQSFEAVFQALLAQPFPGTAKDAVQLLSGKATHIASTNANPEQCFLYLKATALHASHLLEVLQDDGDGGVGGATGSTPGVASASSGASSTSGVRSIMSEINRNGLSNNGFNLKQNSQGYETEQRLLSDIVQAAGCAVTQCRHRSDISRSGIIPVLAELAISCQQSKTMNSSSEPSAKNTPATLNIMHHQSQQNQTPLAQKQAYTHSTNNTQVAHVLTAAHTELLQACIAAGHYSYACAFTDQFPVLSVQPFKVKSTITAEQYLRYFYLLGMARLGMKRFYDAKLAFEVALTMPSHVVSAVIIACRKKHLLVKCLLLQEEDEEPLMRNTARSQGNWNVFSPEEEYDSPESSGGNAIGSSGGGGIGNIATNSKIILNHNPSNPNRSTSKQKSVKDLIYELPKSVSPAVAQFFKNSLGSSSASEYDFMRGGVGFGGSESVGDKSSGEDRMSHELHHPAQASNSNTNPETNSSPNANNQKIGNSKYSNLEAYHELVNSFISDNWDTFQKIKKLRKQIFKSDGNWGLINQVHERTELPRKIRRIAKLYEVIPLSKLANKLNLSSAEEAEVTVRKIIMEQDLTDAWDFDDEGSESTIQAQIDEEEGVVHFLSKDLPTLTGLKLEKQQQDLTARIKRCMQLTERMQSLDIALSTSHKFIAENNNALKYRGGAGSGSGSGSGNATSNISGVPRGVADFERRGGLY